jgi:predicted NBD/HSP70 family sugar kinase
MPSSMETAISGLKLARGQTTALRKKAQRHGLTPEAYVRQLIARDLALDSLAAGRSFDELATPFRKALGGLTDKEIDQLVRPASPPRKTRR